MTKTTTTTTQAQEQTFTEWINSLNYFDYAEFIVNKVLTNLHGKTAQKFIYQLQNQARNDRKARNGHKIAEQITQAQNRKNEHRNEQHTATKQAYTIENPADIRTAYYKIAQYKKALADNEQSHIDALNDEIGLNASDREDLIQTALLQYVINQKEPTEICDTILHSYDVESADELTAEQLQEARARQDYKNCCKAVNNKINSMQHLTALNSNKTQVQHKLPLEITKQFGADYITFNGRLYIWNDKQEKYITPTAPNGSYYAFEHKNTKNRFGWYSVYHYKTMRNVSRIEHFTNENGEQTDITPYTANFDQWEQSKDTSTDRLYNIINTAQLTPRQRIWCDAYTSNQAEIYGARARAKYFDIATNPNQKTALQIEYKARKKYAFMVLVKLNKISDNEKTQANFYTELKKALKQAL